jgi:hypothetical protein
MSHAFAGILGKNGGSSTGIRRPARADRTGRPAPRAKSPGHESRVKMASMTTNRSASFLLLALLSGAAVVAAADPKPLTALEATDAAAETQMRINDAIPIVGKLKEDPKANDLLGRAKGIVIVPHYFQAALVFGGRGGSGLLLVRRGMKWSDPVFYRISGGTFGAQIGGTKGSLAFFQIYYNNPEITAQQILSGTVSSPQSKLLLDVLPPPQAPQPPKPTQPARPR